MGSLSYALERVIALELPARPMATPASRTACSGVHVSDNSAMTAANFAAIAASFTCAPLVTRH